MRFRKIYNASPRIQPRLRGGWLHALAHHGAPQRADAVDHVKSEAAHALHRQEIASSVRLSRSMASVRLLTSARRIFS